MVEDPQVDDADFFKLLASADALSAAIRGTLFVEVQLKKLVSENVSNPAALTKLQLDYDGWVSLAVALGLNDGIARPVRALGTIRNALAHRLDADITEREARNLYKAFSPDDAQRVQAVFARTIGKQKGGTFNKLDPFDRFVLMVSTIRAALVVARHQARGTRPGDL